LLAGEICAPQLQHFIQPVSLGPPQYRQKVALRGIHLRQLSHVLKKSPIAVPLTWA
jgi:hypothetical protein